MVESNELKDILCLYNRHIEQGLIEKTTPLFNYVDFKKGDIIVSNKGICKTCFFLSAGFTRTYSLDGTTEKTLWFGEKGDLLTSFQSLYNGTQGYEIIVALTECKTLAIDMQVFKGLIKTYPEIAEVYIKIVELGYLYWERRFLIQSRLNAEERYREWMSRAAHVSLHISLGVLAEYLNIDQATLSRIRAKKT